MISFRLVEPYHCKGRFLEDFEALCRQAQINYIVPVVLRPKPPTTPVVPLTASESKEKAQPKTAKGVTSKERDAVTAPGNQQTEAEQNETSSGFQNKKQISRLKQSNASLF